MTKNDRRYLTLALGVALTSTCRMKHGAVVTKSGRVLAVSPNVFRNDPRYVDWKLCSIHAEWAAMKKAGFPKRATLYVARTNAKGEPRLSKPCEGCASFIETLKCRVVHT